MGLAYTPHSVLERLIFIPKEVNAHPNSRAWLVLIYPGVATQSSCKISYEIHRLQHGIVDCILKTV